MNGVESITPLPGLPEDWPHPRATLRSPFPNRSSWWQSGGRALRRYPSLFWSVFSLACLVLLGVSLIVVQQTTRLLSQAWEQIQYRDLEMYGSAQNIFEADPVLATMSGQLRGTRCPIEEELPAGQILFFDTQSGNLYRLPVAENQTEFQTTLLENSYLTFFQRNGDSQPVQAATSIDHRLSPINILAQRETKGLQVCDQAYQASDLPAELQPLPPNQVALAQPQTHLAADLPPTTATVTQETSNTATIHGLVCAYGADTYPAGTVLLYNIATETLFKAGIEPNTNVFSLPIPAGEYLALFEPRNPSLPKYGYTAYVTCGLDPDRCADHFLLSLKIEADQEYGQIQLCDPQYNQAGLPVELQYTNE